jgi:hypothetical protein
MYRFAPDPKECASANTARKTPTLTHKPQSMQGDLHAVFWQARLGAPNSSRILRPGTFWEAMTDVLCDLLPWFVRYLFHEVLSSLRQRVFW